MSQFESPFQVIADMGVKISQLEELLAEALRKMHAEADAHVKFVLVDHPKALAETQEKWRHYANEWADTACNAQQWLKNLRDKYGTPEEAIADIQMQIDRVRNERP